MESLRRSGYMLESMIVQNLNESGFFVEPNQSLVDERTGISRELDLVAEFWNHNLRHKGICVRTHFVMEVINNLYPFVLVTRRPFSPNSPTDDYLRYVTTPSEDDEDHFLRQHDIFEGRGIETWQIFSQYSSFTRKKGNNELLAYHPDDVHSSLQKMVEYSLDAIDRRSSCTSDECWRLFFWQPILVLRDDLFIVTGPPSEQPRLEPVFSAKLEYNFHHRGKPETMIVDIVVESHLLDILKGYVQQDEVSEDKISAIKNDRDASDC